MEFQWSRKLKGSRDKEPRTKEAPGFYVVQGRWSFGSEGQWVEGMRAVQKWDKRATTNWNSGEELQGMGTNRKAGVGNILEVGRRARMV